MSIKIAPSILAANFMNLAEDINMVNKSEADWFHIDVMDGVFVPNISFGMPVLKAIRKEANKPLDVHLMIIDPDRYIENFASLGASILTIHYEACIHLHRSLQKIKSFGMKAGIALNPHTPISNLTDIIMEIDLVCLMSVNPGFGGQKFIESVLPKITDMRKIIDECPKEVRLEVDGGINPQNIKTVCDAGADTFVLGSAIFNTDDYASTITDLRNNIR